LSSLCLCACRAAGVERSSGRGGGGEGRHTRLGEVGGKGRGVAEAMQVDFDDAEVDHIAPRREFNDFAPVRPGVLHCFGVDFMSNKDVLDLFAEFEPKEVQWLDDSSCNVFFKEDDVPALVMEKLSNGEPPEQDVWRRTRPLKALAAKGGAEAAGKPRKGPTRVAVKLQIRLATEADRKDPGHSGHTDSVFYAQNKEKQVLHQQQLELRRTKKQKRMSRLPQSTDASVERGLAGGAGTAAAAGAANPEAKGADALGASAATVSSSGALRLGCRGILDPLLYLRAGSAGLAAASSGGAAATAEGGGGEGGSSGSKSDLADVLRKAEAEYASLPGGLGSAEGAAAQRQVSAEGRRGRETGAAAGGRGKGAAKGGGKGGAGGEKGAPARRRERTPGRPDAGGDRRQQKPQQQQQQQQQQQDRGRKRRPVEQEPRPVSDAAPPQRGVKALPEVEAFLARHRLRCQRVRLLKTFRGIIYGQQKRKKDVANGVKVDNGNAGAAQGNDAGAGVAAVPGQPVADKITAESKPVGDAKEPPPWEQYVRANSKFVKTGHFLHTVAWEVNGRYVLAVIPHEHKVDQERLAKAIREPPKAIRLRKLQDIAKQTGWPVFVCPPFGHAKDREGREPVLLVDASVTEFKKPLLFDCGTIGLSLSVSDFLRSTGANCVEGLAIPQAPKKTAPAAVLQSASVASPEPAPEPESSVAGSPMATEPTKQEAPPKLLVDSAGGPAAMEP